MGISAAVFEEEFAPADGDPGSVWAWISARRAAGKWQRPETSSNVLQSWFSEMREAFPLIADAHPDDSRGTEYCFYKNFVEIVFAGSVGEEGVVTAWKLAYKHGLRMLVGDELLPRSASEGKRQVHISVLDGSKANAQSTGRRNICIAILDPELAPASGARQWVLDQLDVDRGSDDASSIRLSVRLRQWNDEFTSLDLSGVHTESKFFPKFIVLRARPKDVGNVAPAAMELAKRLDLRLWFFENL